MAKFYMHDEVTDWTEAEFKQWLADLGENDEAVIHIDSVGGDVFAGLGICQAIRNANRPVIAECGIIVASIASIIALACDKIRPCRDSFFMIHEPWACAMGNADELIKVAQLLEQSAVTLKKYISDKIKDQELVDGLFDGDNWFNAEHFAEMFNDVEVVENPEKGEALFAVAAKYKSTPDELLKLVDSMKKPEIPEVKEEEKEIVLVDNSYAESVLAQMKGILGE